MNFDKQAQGSLVGQSGRFIRQTVSAQPEKSSPVDQQIENLKSKLAVQHGLIDVLINKMQPAMQGDPRLASGEDCAASAPTSCRLESDLCDLADKLTSHNTLLNEAIQRIQL